MTTLRIAFFGFLCAFGASAQLSLSLNADATQIAYPGDTTVVSWEVAVTNDGPTAVTISAFACSTITGDPSGTILLPTESASFSVEILISAAAVPGTLLSTCAGATSDANGYVGVVLHAAIETPAPYYTLYQAHGPGSLVDFACFNVYASEQYHAVFSFGSPNGGSGTGPYFGLFAPNPTFLIDQFLLPPDTPPFRFTSTGSPSSSIELGSYTLPPGLILEWVVFYPRHFPPFGAPPYQWTPVNALTVI